MSKPPLDSVSMQTRAEEIAQQYLSDLPPDYAGRHSAIAEPSVITTLFRAITAGLNQRDACAAAGISARTFQTWQQRADDEPDSAYGAFFADLKAVRAQGKAWHLENIKRHSQKEWTASAWTLERTDPEQFALRKDSSDAPKVVVQIGVRDGDVQVSLSPTPQGQLSEGEQKR